MLPLLAMAGAGAGIGAAGNIGQTLLQQSAASKQRTYDQRALTKSDIAAQQQFAQISGSPEYAASQAWIRQLYGIDPNAQASKADSLGGYMTRAGTMELSATKTFQGQKGSAKSALKANIAREMGLKDMTAAERKEQYGLTDVNKIARAETGKVAEQLQEFGRLQKLQQAGVALTEEEQLQLESFDQEEMYRSLVGMGENQRALLSDQLRKGGFSLQNWQDTYGALKQGAGVPTEEAGGGFDFAAALQGNPMVQQFQKGLQQAQGARGLFGSNAAAAAEGSGMAATLFGLQQQMLPQLMGLPTQQSDLLYKLQMQSQGRMQPMGQMAVDYSGMLGGGISGITQGAAGGAILGKSFGMF